MNLTSPTSANPSEPPHHYLGAAAILVSDLTCRRLLESVLANLELKCSCFDPAKLDVPAIFNFEVILAEESAGRALRPLINQEQTSRQQFKPALIAIVPSPYRGEFALDGTFDSILALPDKPDVVAAQLSVALYAHRAFAVRYQSALEELSLNRNIFKSVTSGICVANAQLPDLPLMYVNPAFEVMTGYSLEEVVGKNCRFLQNGLTDQPGLTLIREALDKKSETVVVIRNFRKDGTPFWNELAISPIRNAAGELTHFVGIQSDVTERVEFEIALRESEKLAAVGRLASTIAHEINNPLEAVMNLLYLAQQSIPRTAENAEARQYLHHADLEVQRIKLITAQSLRFYKQSTGPEPLSVSELFDSTLNVYMPRFSNYNITVERRDRATRQIVCLVSEIRQVISNLISNAIDAMRAGGGRLLIRTRQATHWRTGAHGVLLTVADTGSGMSAHTIASIYKAFFTTKGVGGNGLGLWISAEIVARHRGHLHVRSSQQPGRSGTVFELFLPNDGVARAPAAEA